MAALKTKSKVSTDRSVFLLLGNQQFDPSILKRLGCSEAVLIEDFGLCTYEKHHKLKLYLYLTSMREYRDELEASGICTHYFALEDAEKSKNYFDRLESMILKEGISFLNLFEIEDQPFESKLKAWLSRNKTGHNVHPSPGFIFTREEFAAYCERGTSEKKNYRMALFYQYARKKTGLLLGPDNKPVGGKWSLDDENRKKIPLGLEIPPLPKIEQSKHHTEISRIIDKHFSEHPGNLGNIWFPVTRKDALEQLQHFLRFRFENFGVYEDAMVEGEHFLFHSTISPALNIGLLTPTLVIQAALEQAEKNSIPLNSLEGFIRQIIGWREFIRGIYQIEGCRQIESNYWNHDRELSQSWYTGETGILPLDDCIRGVIETGYGHHIPRLMVICNLMNLCEVHPKAIYRWFMEMYIDSSEWVMVPNVFGMATYSDAGLMSTKPYTCGSNYILKMSNYKKGEWCDTVDGLYWSFIERNRDFYEKNPRLGFQVRLLDKLDIEKKTRIFSRASSFIEEHTR